MADQISDSVLDHMLAQDPNSRVACETLVTTGLALLAGEVTTKGYVNLPEVVRGTLGRIGYNDSACGIDAATCSVLTSLDPQSDHIAMGVDHGGAGDQGMILAMRQTRHRNLCHQQSNMLMRSPGDLHKCGTMVNCRGCARMESLR